MRFDVYGWFEIEVVRTGAAWTVYRRYEGKRRPMHEIVIPPGLEAQAIPRYLDDLLHEYARPGRVIRQVDG